MFVKDGGLSTQNVMFEMNAAAPVVGGGAGGEGCGEGLGLRAGRPLGTSWSCAWHDGFVIGRGRGVTTGQAALLLHPRPGLNSLATAPRLPAHLFAMQIGQGGAVYLDHSLPTLFENTVFRKGGQRPQAGLHSSPPAACSKGQRAQHAQDAPLCCRMWRRTAMPPSPPLQARLAFPVAASPLRWPAMSQ